MDEKTNMSDDTANPSEQVEDAAETAESAAQAEIAQLKEQVLRYAADAENTKRRAEREANDARAFAIQKFARDLLAVADNLSRALAAAPKGEEGDAIHKFVEGIGMTEKALLDAFERNSLKTLMPSPGERFDPNLHQAMMEQPSTDFEAGAVIQALQPGYELLGRLIRPAMVVVAAKGSTGTSSAGSRVDASL
jgi:molecular chaperone GrpE